MNQFLYVGSLDGQAMIEMNNVAVGYLTPQTPSLCIYPPAMPVQVVCVEIGTPAPAAPSADTNR